MSLVRYQYPVTTWPSFNRGASLTQELDHLFASSFADWSVAGAATGAPALDLFENPEAYLVRVELPGVVADQIDLAVHDGVLTVSGERRAAAEPTAGTTVRNERPTGQFTRSLQLPGRVDSARVTAAYKDGVLNVTLPKAEDAKPRRIDVSLN